MKDGDGLLMGNFRADRARQILTALLDPAFDGFTRKYIARFAAALGMVEYSTALAKFMPCAVPAGRADRDAGRDRVARPA